MAACKTSHRNCSGSIHTRCSVLGDRVDKKDQGPACRKCLSVRARRAPQTNNETSNNRVSSDGNLLPEHGCLEQPRKASLRTQGWKEFCGGRDAQGERTASAKSLSLGIQGRPGKCTSLQDFHHLSSLMLVSLPTWVSYTCLIRNVPPSLQPTWGSRPLRPRAGSGLSHRSLMKCVLVNEPGAGVAGGWGVVPQSARRLAQ